MNILSGKYKGRNIVAPNSARPTLARIKNSLFSIIREYINSDVVCLDLFAGSGALGFEVLSMGAKETYFIDSDKNAVKTIEQNLNGVDKSLYSIFCTDYLTALRSFSKQGKTFDIIFIDPPYNSKFGPTSIEIIMRLNLLNSGGIIVYETDDKKRLPTLPEGCIITKQKEYGLTKIFIFERI